MRRALAWSLLGCIAILATPALTHAAEARVALVIGNGNYPSSRLKNPVSDATAMAEKLRALGFDVILRTETSRRDMTRAINDFGGKLAPGNMALFYYAGHGMQVKGKNFLIPVDAEIDNEDMVRTEGIDVDRLLERLNISRMNVVILDACRDNPFEKFRGGSGGLAEIDAPIGTFLAYATAPGKLAADGDGTNGLYTTELLKAIDVPGLKIEDVFKQVRINVLKASANKQVPWESSSMTGEFYFRPDAKSAAVDAQLRRAEQERLELQREMEKLRAELTRMIGTALSLSANAASVQTAATTATGPLPSSTAVPATLAPVAIQPAFPESWDARIALLSSLHGQLTYPKAFAILFDIKDENELTELVRFERFLMGSGWASAHAIGIDDHGKPFWVNADRYRNANFATSTAIEFCAKDGIHSCKIILENGEFREKEFFEFANRLIGFNPLIARQAYLQRVTKTPTETFTAGGSGMGRTNGNHPARIFTSALD